MSWTLNAFCYADDNHSDGVGFEILQQNPCETFRSLWVAA